MPYTQCPHCLSTDHKDRDVDMVANTVTEVHRICVWCDKVMDVWLTGNWESDCDPDRPTHARHSQDKQEATNDV